MNDNGSNSEKTYRNLVWAMVFSLVFGVFGYAFFLHTQISEIQRAQDRRDYWWVWIEKENDERRGELRAIREQVEMIKREIRPYTK